MVKKDSSRDDDQPDNKDYIPITQCATPPLPVLDLPVPVLPKAHKVPWAQGYLGKLLYSTYEPLDFKLLPDDVMLCVVHWHPVRNEHPRHGGGTATSSRITLVASGGLPQSLRSGT